MYLYYRNFLQEVNGAYRWHYWDIHPALPNTYEIQGRPEDFSHAGLSMGCCLEAARRGFLFDDADMVRFASTLVDVMWNGDAEKPRFGAAVDTNQGDEMVFGEWALLAQWDSRVEPLIRRMFEEVRADRPNLLPNVAVCQYRARDEEGKASR